MPAIEAVKVIQPMLAQLKTADIRTIRREGAAAAGLAGQLAWPAWAASAAQQGSRQAGGNYIRPASDPCCAAEAAHAGQANCPGQTRRRCSFATYGPDVRGL